MYAFSDFQLDDIHNRFGTYSKVALSWEDVKVSVTLDSSKGPPCFRSKNSSTKKDILKGGKSILSANQSSI